MMDTTNPSVHTVDASHPHESGWGKMDPSRSRFWQATATSLSGIGTVLAALVAAVTFVYQQRDSAKQDNVNRKSAAAIAYKREAWNREVAAYTEVCEAAGAIVVPDLSAAEFHTRRAAFERLYYGNMMLFEDQKVANTLKKFEAFVWGYDPTNKMTVLRLREGVTEVSEACQEYISSQKQTYLPASYFKDDAGTPGDSQTAT